MKRLKKWPISLILDPTKNFESCFILQIGLNYQKSISYYCPFKYCKVIGSLPSTVIQLIILWFIFIYSYKMQGWESFQPWAEKAQCNETIVTAYFQFHRKARNNKITGHLSLNGPITMHLPHFQLLARHRQACQSQCAQSAQSVKNFPK